MQVTGASLNTCNWPSNFSKSGTARPCTTCEIQLLSTARKVTRWQNTSDSPGTHHGTFVSVAFELPLHAGGKSHKQVTANTARCSLHWTYQRHISESTSNRATRIDSSIWHCRRCNVQSLALQPASNLQAMCQIRRLIWHFALLSSGRVRRQPPVSALLPCSHHRPCSHHSGR